MKKYLSKTKIVALATITLITTTVAASVFTLKSAKRESDKMELSYTGNVNELPVYRLSLNNKTTGVYFISIIDKDGHSVYCQDVEGTNIVRNFQFDNKIYANNYDLTFMVTDMKGATVGTYKVSNNKNAVNEISINEVK